MKGIIMRTGSAARRNRILQTLAPDRQQRIAELREMISSDDYLEELDGKLDLVADDLIEEAVKSRN